jgi:hypothetical protein
MSLPLASAGATSALPAMNVHSHGHGHKKGLESATDPTDATDSTSDADAPTGSTQSLFGNLLSSMEQVMGTQSANGSTQTPASTQPVSMNQTATQAASAAQAASATSSMGDTAKALLSTIGSALKFLA